MSSQARQTAALIYELLSSHYTYFVRLYKHLLNHESWCYLWSHAKQPGSEQYCRVENRIQRASGMEPRYIDGPIIQLKHLDTQKPSNANPHLILINQNPPKTKTKHLKTITLNLYLNNTLYNNNSNNLLTVKKRLKIQKIWITLNCSHYFNECFCCFCHVVFYEETERRC